MDKWKHRRRFAYAGVVSGLLFPFLVMFDKDVIGIAAPFYTFVTLTITVFIGGAVVDDKWQK